MKVLMISGDPEVLDPKSETGKRMEEYRSVLGELDILVCRGNVFNFVSGFFRGLKMMWLGYDIITAQDMEHSLLAWMFSKIYGVPWQMQIHTDIFSPYFIGQSMKNKIRAKLATFLLPRAAGIRVVSESLRFNLIKSYEVEPRKVSVLPVFVDIEKIKKSPIKTDLHKKYPGKFIILMASRITKEKNIGLAIEAFSLARSGKRSPLPLLLIVGDGPEVQSLRQIAAENVTFESHTDDLISYYKTCDLFLLASNYEGYGRTLVEATAAGAKVLSSDVGVAPEILKADSIFKVGDKADLISKLENAILGQISYPRIPKAITKEGYLGLYKESLEACKNQ